MPPPKKPSGAEFRKIRNARKEEQKNLAHTINKWILSNPQQDSAASTSQLQTDTTASPIEDVDTPLDRLEKKNKSDIDDEAASDAKENYGMH